MDSIKTLTEHNINIQNEKHQESRGINAAQLAIKMSTFLTRVFLETLTPEEEKEQKKLMQAFLKNLKIGDPVALGLNYSRSGDMIGVQDGIVVSNDGEKIKIQAGFLNKNFKTEKGIRSFSTKNGSSLGPAETSPNRDKSDGTSRFFIIIPTKYTIKSPRGITQEMRDEINELYKQAGDPKTCYDLINIMRRNNKNDNLFIQ